MKNASKKGSLPSLTNRLQ